MPPSGAARLPARHYAATRDSRRLDVIMTIGDAVARRAGEIIAKQWRDIAERKGIAPFLEDDDEKFERLISPTFTSSEDDCASVGPPGGMGSMISPSRSRRAWAYSTSGLDAAEYHSQSRSPQSTRIIMMSHRYAPAHDIINVIFDGRKKAFAPAVVSHRQ